MLAVQIAVRHQQSIHCSSCAAFGLSPVPIGLSTRTSAWTGLLPRRGVTWIAKRLKCATVTAQSSPPDPEVKVANGANAFLEGEKESVANQHRSVSRRQAFGRPIASVGALLFGAFTLPFLSGSLVPFLPDKGLVHVDTVITGTFMPVVGILFAMLSSIGVSSLRQRQQDLRDVLNQELAMIRMLLVMIKDESVINLLLTYTRQVESETFSHKKNGISYDHETPGTIAAIRREEAFAKSEETLWRCFSHANQLRLRPEVEGSIRNLVTLRTRRRAVLDSGLPQIHFIIIALLGVSMLLSFGLLVANEARGLDILAIRVLFGILLAMLTLTYALIADLRDPFGGDYGVTPWRLYRTVELLQQRLKYGPDKDFDGGIMGEMHNGTAREHQ